MNNIFNDFKLMENWLFEGDYKSNLFNIVFFRYINVGMELFLVRYLNINIIKVK